MMLRQNKFLSQRGMSLAELMLAVAVMSIIGLGVSGLLAYLYQAQNNLNFNISRLELRNEITQKFLRNNQCFCNFQNVQIPLNLQPDSQIRLNNPIVLRTDPTDCNSRPSKTILNMSGNDKFSVNSIVLNKFSDLGNGQIMSHLKIDITSRRKIFGGQNRTEDYLVMLNVNPGRSIDTCGVQPDVTPQFFAQGPIVTLQRVRQIVDYQFLGVTGQSIGLVKMNFTMGENFEIDFYGSGVNQMRIFDRYAFYTGQDGHIRSTNMLAMLPLIDGKFRARFDSNSRNRAPCTIELVAILPPP